MENGKRGWPGCEIRAKKLVSDACGPVPENIVYPAGLTHTSRQGEAFMSRLFAASRAPVSGLL